MKVFYESDREGSLLAVTHGENYFKPHYHINVEVYLIKSGSYLMTVNDKSFVASAGSIVVADSYDMHGYERIDTLDDNECKILIIPYEYLQNFNLKKQDRKIKNPHIVDKKLCDKLIDFVDNFILPCSSESTKKSAVDYFLALIFDTLEFEDDKTAGSVKLIKNILNYVHSNFKNNITRSTIAKEFGYSEEHISRVFSKFLKTSISKYLNDLRVDYVEKNKNGTKSITELIFEAGFNSQRTYFRAKKNSKKT